MKIRQSNVCIFLSVGENLRKAIFLKFQVHPSRVYIKLLELFVKILVMIIYIFLWWSSFTYFYFCADRSVRITPERPYSPSRGHPHTVTPRKSVPVPTSFEPPQFDISPIHAEALDERFPGDHDGTVQGEFNDHFSSKKSPQKEIPGDIDEHLHVSGFL